MWYYDKKKWAKRELSTKLADQGGCCIWYDEPELLAKVEKRLKQKIDVVPSAQAVQGIVKKLGGAAQYGQEKGGGASALVAEHLEKLRPAVQVLSELEIEAQHNFWNMTKKFKCR